MVGRPKKYTEEPDNVARNRAAVKAYQRRKKEGPKRVGHPFKYDKDLGTKERQYQAVRAYRAKKKEKQSKMKKPIGLKKIWLTKDTPALRKQAQKDSAFKKAVKSIREELNKANSDLTKANKEIVRLNRDLRELQVEKDAWRSMAKGHNHNLLKCHNKTVLNLEKERDRLAEELRKLKSEN